MSLLSLDHMVSGGVGMTLVTHWGRRVGIIIIGLCMI